MKKFSALAFAIPSLLGVGCAHSHAEQVRDARLSQVETETEEALDRVDQRADARDEAIDKTYEQREDAIANADVSDGDAQQELLEAEHDRMEYCASAKATLEKLGVRLDATEQKVSILGGRVPPAVMSELQTAQTEHASISSQLEKLSTTSDRNWEAKRNAIDKRLEDLDDRVDEISDELSDAA